MIEWDPMNKGSDFLNQAAVWMLVAGLSVGGAMGWWMGQLSGSGEGDGNFSDGDRKRISRGDDNGENERGGSARRRENGQAGTKTESKDFARSVRGILRESVPSRRFERFERLLDRVNVGQYPELVALIRANDLDGSGSNVEWEKLWANWGGRDPLGAMEFVSQQDWSRWHPSAPNEARKQTMISWGQVDPEAAKRYVMEGEDLAKGNRDMLYFMVEGWSFVDPKAAADWLIESGMGLEGEYKSVVEAISRQGGQKGLESWFSGLDQAALSPKDRNGFAELIAGKQQEHHPEKAAAFVEANLDKPWVTESRVVAATADAYVSKDPVAALDWASRTGITNAVVSGVASWCRKDLNAAKLWVAENSGTPESSASATVVMRYLTAKDPAAAQAWAESLPDKKLRDRLLDQQ